MSFGSHKRVLFALPLLLLLGCASGGGNKSPTAGGNLGRPMPDLPLTTFDGKPLTLAALRGKVVLLDIWASWCAPCKEEMPLLDDIAARLRSKNVEIVAVSIDEDRSAAEAFLRSRERWNLTLAHDPEGAVPQRLQPQKMPTSYVIDGRGVLRKVHTGFQRQDAARLEAELLELASEL